jgi:hypothetical protein
VIIEGKKYYHVFTAGNYPQANISPEQVNQMAFYYNPNFHEAPVWRGHPDDNTGNDEPEALGWIAPVIASDGKLFISFTHVSDELKNLVDSKKFKYTSIEIKKYKLSSNDVICYLWAMGLTNRAAVPGLEPLNFDEGDNFILPHDFKQSHYKFTEDFKAENIVETIKFVIPINFNNSNSNNMNQLLINTAKLFNLDLSKFVTDESLAEAIKVKFNENAANVTSLNSKITELEGKIANPSGNTTVMKAKIEKLEGEKVIELVDHAVEQKKILPKDKENYILLAKANYDATKTAFASMPVHPALAGQQVVSGIPTGDINLDDPKFMKADGKKLTYEEIAKTPSLIAKHKLTITDVEALKKASE